jgi:uncharacterized membrane protein
MTPHLLPKRASYLIHIILALLVIGYAIFFSIQLLLHYYSFGSRALDLGNMGQSIWNISQGRFFHQTSQPGVTNRLSLHVEPILIPISLLYYLYSGPEILFIFQSIVVPLGALPVFALARLKLKNEGLALVFALVYLMFPAIQGATLLDFHAVTLAPTFLLAAFYYLETRQTRLFTLFAILAVSCKEDITLLVMMLGFYALVVKRQYRLGLATLVLCSAWAYLAVFVIPRAFAGTENIHWNRYDHLGSSPIEIALNMFLQPHLFLNHLQEVEALDYLRLLLAPTAFTALFNPMTLLLALPSLGINLFSNFPPMQRVNSLIYAAPIVPTIIISSIYGVANLKRGLTWAYQRLNQQTNTPRIPRITYYALRITFYVLRLTPLLLGALILTTTFIYQADYGYLPGGGQFRGWEEVTAHHRRAAQIFAQVPPEAALSAQDRLNPHVSNRTTLYIFDQLEDADHILLDVTLDSWPLHPLALRHRVNEFLQGEFGILAAEDGYLLLAKTPPGLPTTLPDSFFDFARVSDPDTFTPQVPAVVTFDDKFQLLGYSLSLGAHEKFLPVLTLYWRALEPLEEDYTLWPFFINRNGQLIEDTRERPLVATLWYPTSRWSPDEIIMTSTLPWDLAPNLGDEFTLAVGIAKKDWGDPAQRLPITQAEANLYTFENKTWVRLGSFERTERKRYQLLTATETTPLQSYHVQFWDIIALTGVDLPATVLKPGDPLPFTLYWQSAAPITVDLTNFAHLLDEQGQVVAQLDWTPQDTLGYLPTSTWQPNRSIIDRQTITLPSDLPPGQYQLIIGWYYAPTGQRLPLTHNDITNGSQTSGDMAPIGVITVE